MILFSGGSRDDAFTLEDARAALFAALDQLGERRRVLALPPDFTRVHSQAGPLTEAVWEYYEENLAAVLPAIGTHRPMTETEIRAMFGAMPESLFRVHDWRSGLVTLGEVPGSFVKEVSEGRLDYTIPIQVDGLLVEGGFDLILSIGQVVPHEVVGMAGFEKNVFIGAGGAEAINKTHFLGAVYGMERMMGRADTPVRRVLRYGAEHFGRDLPVVHVLTVVGLGPEGRPALRGLVIGDEPECFERAASLARQVNVALLDEPLKKVVVYLDPVEFKSTWLGNKSIYRTRMAIADGGELVVLAPGVDRFGEDRAVDGLVRKYGYAGTARVLELIAAHDDLRENLSAAAHLIHGSSEGRFTITYCPCGLSRREVEAVHFRYGDLGEMMARYVPGTLRNGFNRLPDGEEVYFISNPGLGLWAAKERFDTAAKAGACA